MFFWDKKVSGLRLHPRRERELPGRVCLDSFPIDWAEGTVAMGNARLVPLALRRTHFAMFDANRRNSLKIGPLGSYADE